MGGRKKCRSSGKHVVPVWSRLHPRTCRPLACCPQYQALPHPHPAPFQVPQAINPLAESLPNSARSTPRDLAADAPPPAAPLQQQYHAAQQYGGQQLPAGPSLSRPSSFGQLSQQAQQAQRGPVQREGSFRGGLAGLAGKMMGSPMDRLRRLSSGHYQQQAGQHQPRY